MNANQQVQYRKLISYLSPFDSMKINSLEYQEIKKRTAESQKLQFDTEGNEFILRQLGTPVIIKRNYSQKKILPQQLTRQSSKKILDQNPGVKQNGRSNSVNTFNFNSSQANPVPQIQLSKLDHRKRMSQDVNTPVQGNHLASFTPSNTSRRQNQQQFTPSNFSKLNLAQSESEEYQMAENNGSQQKVQHAVFGNKNQIQSSLNLSSIIEKFNLSKSQHQHSIVSKSIVYQEPVKYAWSEIKFKGKLCEGRSFSSAVIYNGQFYFYGGYDAQKGVFKDFVYLTFSQSGPSQFRNVEISAENQETPGRLCRHGAVLRNNSMIIFGGKNSSIQSTNTMFEYNFEERLFHRINPILSNVDEIPHTSSHRHYKKDQNKYLMPPIDSHSMIYDQKRDQLIISGGFLGDTCQYTIDIYTYSFSSNSWTYIPSKTNPEQMPVPRGAHGSVILFDQLYIFGGTDGESILDDMWCFDMDSLIWTKVDYSNSKIQPGPRSGIQMMEFEGYFVVFGGFKSLINERNDLVLFDSRRKEWVYQSERKEIVEMMQNQSVPQSPSRIKQHTNAKGSISISKQILNQNRFESPIKSSEQKQGNIYQYGSQSQLTSPNSKRHVLMPIHHKDEVSEQIIKNRENKHRVSFEKKMQLLKEFEVPEELRNQLLSPIPILQSMKSSLHMLSSCNKSHKYDYINESQLKSQNFQNSESSIRGKHPGARDGYLSAIIGEKLIIFGGDRHRMSLNDTYELNLRMIIDYLKII